MWVLDEGEMTNLVFTDFYLGEVPATDFISGSDLAGRLGFSSGAAINTSASWLKFTKNGVTLLMAKQPLRNNLSWDVLNTAGLVDGSSTITIGDNLYKIRLPSGASDDPARVLHDTMDPEGTANSDWNRLLEQVCSEVPDSRWPTFTSSDLGIVPQAAGASTICSNHSAWNQSNVDAAGYVVLRGYKGVQHYWATPTGGVSIQNSWRPVLELVGRSPQADDKFLGEVTAANFITNAALTSAVGLTNGTSQNSGSAWLKFQLGNDDGTIKTILVAKQPFRYGLSFNQLKAKNLLKGDSAAPVVTIGGKRYRVRCIRGASTDPATALHNTTNPKGTRNSEWARTIQNVSASYAYSKKWANYSDTDLGAVVSGGTYANGASTICMEDSTTNQSNAVTTGYYVLRRSINNYFVTTVANVNADIGWRPVLEEIA